MSLLSWERGLKYQPSFPFWYMVYVAPLVGAWIEIENSNIFHELVRVAPLVGAWIEISTTVGTATAVLVAPLVGAWIEITTLMSGYRMSLKSLLSWERGLKFLKQNLRAPTECRSSRGSVD